MKKNDEEPCRLADAIDNQTRVEVKKHKGELIRSYVLIILGFIAFMYIISALMITGDNSEISGGCVISGIEYRDVSPDDCWGDEEMNMSSHCPLPKDIECNGNVKALGSMIGSMIANI